MSSLTYAGYILALVGGILIVIFSSLGILGSPFLAFSPIAAVGAIANGVVGFIIGIICIIGSKYVGNLGWAIVLIILGIIAGGVGGVLVVLGGLLGLVSRL
ncbi:MAG: hypothetical protein M1167_04525 [Chloroflexi bacterium]|nr:hypothetical protein [Chloroflexota bacterium]